MRTTPGIVLKFLKIPHFSVAKSWFGDVATMDMKFSPHLTALFILAAITTGSALTPQEMAQRYHPIPSVPEKDLPAMKNKSDAFSGFIKQEGLEGHTWVRFPFVENPGSFGIDRKGRVLVAEVNRFWQGVPDLRGVNEFIRGDFQSQTLEDRAKLQDSIPGRFPEGFFTNTPDRIIRLEDTDGNGAADRRTLFSDQFKGPLEGIGFSLLPEDDGVYFTCIPNLWKLTDANDDGVADKSEALVTGFGVRISFIGHDLHGIVRGPDGRLYFSVGDRSYHVTTPDGRVLNGDGTGAIFRCESDGSGFEVFCKGLRNPTELVFDELGNLFTFDNTGDFGDKARMVYALEGTDSGWNMKHQSPHQYVGSLDWEDFHPAKSMWVAERMDEPFNEDQPQSFYPPAANVARGPSGVTLATGDSLPPALRGKFLLTDYGGAVVSCNLYSIGAKPSGAGYALDGATVVAGGVGASDVEMGYDGNIYVCDFGGGWSINTNGAIHVLTPTDKTQQAAGARMAEVFKRGVAGESSADLVGSLQSSDRRLRQMAQFELVKRGAEGQASLTDVAKDAAKKNITRLHGVWGLGQLARQNNTAAVAALVDLASDGDSEIRANVARALGDAKGDAVRAKLLAMLGDESLRVRSLAGIALSRVVSQGDAEVIGALYQLAAANGSQVVDPVLRHACLTALDRIGSVESAVAHASDAQREVRMMAMLYLRRQGSAELSRFLNDSDPQIRIEAIRCIYDSAAVDTAAGEAIAALAASVADLPVTVQRRIVAANYRVGTSAAALRLIEMAGSKSLDITTREAALQGLCLWEKRITADPVFGGYRPIKGGERSMKALGTSIGEALKIFLAGDQPPKLAALGLKLADESGVTLEATTLKDLIANKKLKAEVRVAALDSLVKNAPEMARAVVAERLSDKSADLAAAALRHGLALKLDGIAKAAKKAIETGPIAVARAGVEVIASLDPADAITRWKERESSGLSPEVWLDLYLALQSSTDESAKALTTAFAASALDAVPRLSVAGGDPQKGEIVFRNQGGCMQCHQMGKDGGIQGPPLTLVGERLPPEKLVESLVNPNAEIAKGYGLSSITMNDGNVAVGRIAEETKDTLSLVGVDGKSVAIARAQVKTIAPPVSAMPPMALALPPRDLRDLVAYLRSRNKTTAPNGEDAESHGDREKVSK